MKKQIVSNNSLFSRVISLAVLAITCLSFSVASFSLVSADQYDEKIRALNNENGELSEDRNQLGAEASTLAGVVNKLQAQIDAKQAQIIAHQNEVNKLREEIRQAEIELERQRSFLGETIKDMYLEGEISTVEMLASSKDLSDFFDKQQYRESVRSKLKSTLDKITQLKLDLNTRKQKTEKLIAEQKQLKDQLLGQQNEKNHLLSLNQNEQNQLSSELRHNSAKIAELRKQQAIENARHGSGLVPGDPSKGGYPAKWANAPQDSVLDDWGMYNRECVSYAAWKVYQSGRHMPYWGGRGNANQWPDNTSNKSKTPRAGTVAIAYWGYYGHAMYVEAVSGNQIYVSQYNYGVQGEYSEMWISASDIDWYLSF